MPRYVIERDFGQVGDDEMQEIAARSKLNRAEEFPEMRWERSYVCADDGGSMRSFCVYLAPSSERLQAHVDRVGGYTAASIYEIVGDVTPDQVTV
jgi:Protein of unknown function (DUF4242)